MSATAEDGEELRPSGPSRVVSTQANTGVALWVRAKVKLQMHMTKDLVGITSTVFAKEPSAHARSSASETRCEATLSTKANARGRSGCAAWTKLVEFISAGK